MNAVVTKKTLISRATSINEGVGSKISDFARRQMEKMGWRDGQGLGKLEDGISTHIKVKKIEGNAGIGEAAKELDNVNDQWWFGVFDKNAKKLKIKIDDEGSNNNRRNDCLIELWQRSRSWVGIKKEQEVKIRKEREEKESEGKKEGQG